MIVTGGVDPDADETPLCGAVASQHAEKRTGGNFHMATLAQEYIDTREIKHKVEHLTVSTDDKHNQEQILEELFRALVKPKKHVPA